ncbi:hypothetical protein Micbo1qcDRAFT_161802 [Microdochium bolleyi]|uniref:Uncharacterized protein n=1 Tax=Microdochium bolleyi TaxID=196109 RepID=A0A136J3F9_9PEZI|nr:hypothetical protein Micbo1qcDRAFT_161802 [Microdochium bolleyi]
MKTSTAVITAATLLAGTTTAASFERRATGGAPLVASDIIATIAPKSTSCADTKECRTNVQVGEAFIQAFLAYEIYQPAAMASILALVALESGEFKYKRNLQHANPADDQKIHWGQGTSNMQLATFNLEFARSFPELASQVGTPGDTMEAKNKILDLVVDDKYNFKSGPWFYATQADCAPAREAFKGTDADAGYQAHMKCVGVDASNAERMQYWTLAKKAFNLA